MKVKETNVLDVWATQYPSVQRWLAKLKVKAKNAFSLYRFCEWADKQPPELLALKKNPASKEAEKLLDTFVAAETPEFTNPVKYHIVTAVKSFYKHNYCDLARASGALTYEKARPTTMPKKEALRKLWNWALNPRDKSLITFVNSTAVARGTIPQLKWRHIEEDWENIELPCMNIPGKLLKGGGVGRYKGVRQITFLTPEAKRDLLNYKRWLEAKMGRKLTPEDYIWLNVYAPYGQITENTLGYLMWKLPKDAGVHFSWHDARRYVQTAMETVRMPNNWIKKIKGRKVRGEEAPYSRPAIEQLRERFREAVSLLEFISEKPRVSEGDLRIKSALDQLRMSGRFSEEQLKKWENEWRGRSPETAIHHISLEAEALQRIAEREGINLSEGGYMIPKALINEEMEHIKKERMRPKSATNGGHADCQRIVSEQELPTLLAEGWRVAAVLPSGKVVVSND